MSAVSRQLIRRVLYAVSFDCGFAHPSSLFWSAGYCKYFVTGSSVVMVYMHMQLLSIFG